MSRLGFWGWTKALLVGWAFLTGLFFHRAPTPMPAAQGIGYVVILSVLVPLALLPIIGIQAANPRSDRVWTYPAWADNPLNFGQPLRFFHFGTFNLGATAVGAGVATLLGWSSDYWPICGAGGLSIGLWLGVNLAWRAFGRKRAAVVRSGGRPTKA